MKGLVAFIFLTGSIGQIFSMDHLATKTVSPCKLAPEEITISWFPWQDKNSENDSLTTKKFRDLVDQLSRKQVECKEGCITSPHLLPLSNSICRTYYTYMLNEVLKTLSKDILYSAKDLHVYLGESYAGSIFQDHPTFKRVFGKQETDLDFDKTSLSLGCKGMHGTLNFLEALEKKCECARMMWPTPFERTVAGVRCVLDDEDNEQIIKAFLELSQRFQAVENVDAATPVERTLNGADFTLKLLAPRHNFYRQMFVEAFIEASIKAQSLQKQNAVDKIAYPTAQELIKDESEFELEINWGEVKKLFFEHIRRSPKFGKQSELVALG